MNGKLQGDRVHRVPRRRRRKGHEVSLTGPWSGRRPDGSTMDAGPITTPEMGGGERRGKVGDGGVWW
jgi:hypothetical protein